MRYSLVLCIVLSLFFLLCGCANPGNTTKDNLSSIQQENISSSSANDNSGIRNAIIPDSIVSDSFPSKPEYPPSGDNPFKINGRAFSIDEVNKGIKDTFNNMMYLYGGIGWLENEDILNKDIEYDLYLDLYGYNKNHPFYAPKTVYVVITNIQHLLSVEENISAYAVGIYLTEYGLRSNFCYSNNHLMYEPFEVYDGVPISYSFGRYTMRIDEIVKPQYEIMDTQWVENIKNEIQIYMDDNNFNQAENDLNLATGNYHVYVQKFFRSDSDSTIIFEHENGSVYTGWYNYVHECSGNFPANLNQVQLVENPDDESFRSYLDKVRADPAVDIEYSVK